MHKWSIAREAKALARQVDRMKMLDPEDCGIYVDDIRARIARMGLTFEDVVQAGIHRLARVPASMVRIVAEEPELISFVTTANWRIEVQDALAHRSEHLSRSERTFLQIKLAEGAVTSRELSALEAVISDAYVSEYRAELEWEKGSPESPPPRTNSSVSLSRTG